MYELEYSRTVRVSDTLKDSKAVEDSKELGNSETSEDLVTLDDSNELEYFSELFLEDDEIEISVEKTELVGLAELWEDEDSELKDDSSTLVVEEPAG